MADVPEAPGPNAPTEPLVSVGAITAVASAALTAGVAFGLHLTTDQTAAVLGLVAVLAPIVVALWGRTKVYSPATVRALIKKAGA